jgi:hypothetical protein
MSAYEHKQQANQENGKRASYQDLLIAAPPYPTICFRLPNLSIDRSSSSFFTFWDSELKRFTLQFQFKKDKLKENEKYFNQGKQSGEKRKREEALNQNENAKQRQENERNSDKTME